MTDANFMPVGQADIFLEFQVIGENARLIENEKRARGVTFWSKRQNLPAA